MDNVSVELPSRMVSQYPKCFLLGATSTIRTIRDHCIERVSHEDDTGTDRYLVDLKTTRVTRAIAVFVVMSDNLRCVR